MLVLAVLFAAAGATGGCAARGTVDSLQDKVRALELENFRLRKELAEARVRQQMGGGRPSQETTGRRGGAESPGSPSSGPMSEESFGREREAAGVIVSEPITDASRWTWAPSADGDRSGGTMSGGGTPERLMIAAQASLDAHDPEGALVHFRDIVVNHRDSAVADDAQFGVGECYFQMGRYDEAIAEYRRVVEDFAFGDRVPYAFLKIGFAQLALEQRDAALDSFRTVSEAYPGTEAATVARQQIAHLARP